MGFDCFRSGDDKNTVLRSCPIESDSLVNDQILREIRRPESDASLRLSSDSNLLFYFLIMEKTKAEELWFRQAKQFIANYRIYKNVRLGIRALEKSI